MTKTLQIYIACHLLGFAGLMATLWLVMHGYGRGLWLGAAGGGWMAGCIIAGRLYVIRHRHELNA